jgi:hypothetical protein
MVGRTELRHRVMALIQRAVEGAGDSPDLGRPEDVDALALDVLRYQAAANPVYGRLVAAHGLEPAQIANWWDFPPIPVRGFRETPSGPIRAPFIGDPSRAEATFLTSGTTGGDQSRGVHRVRDLALYHASLLAWAREGLGWDGQPIRILALLPPPDARPESSLSHMAGVLMAHWDDGAGGYFMDGHWALSLDAVESALGQASADGRRVLFLATAFALVHWLGQREGHPPHRLPPGSTVMETGGFKGRTREVPRADLYRATAEALGLATDAIINEYGMTEMLSQFYDARPRRIPVPELDGRVHQGPPWVRTRVLNPVDLSPAAPGRPGLLAHLDLANLDSAAYLLTEDLGVEAPSGFRILGRSPGSPPRGCSLSMEAWISASQGALRDP